MCVWFENGTQDKILSQTSEQYYKTFYKLTQAYDNEVLFWI